MVKKIQINMSDRLFYVLVVVGVMSLLGVGVYAYNSGASPSVMGHSVEEKRSPYGNMQVVIKNKKTSHVTAASDKRGIGKSVVFH